MPLPYFENDLSSGYLQDPNNYFRGLQQAAIDGLFDCTSAKYTIQEQDSIGSTTYHNIDVWLDYIVGTTSTGLILHQLLYAVTHIDTSRIAGKP